MCQLNSSPALGAAAASKSTFYRPPGGGAVKTMAESQRVGERKTHAKKVFPILPGCQPGSVRWGVWSPRELSGVKSLPLLPHASVMQAEGHRAYYLLFETAALETSLPSC